MTLEEIKSAVKILSVEERRKLAVFILELEKNHFRDTLGPQITEDLESLSRVLQETVDKIKNAMK
ncbi:MAG: hypothetical protein WB699_13540 [Bacteroidota bacterium]